MKYINNTNKYSVSVAWIALLFSFYSWLITFSLGFYYWVLQGILLILVFLTLTMGIDQINSILSLPGISFATNLLLRIFASTCFFLSSLHGFIYFLLQLNILDHSIIIFPILISIFLFSGASIGLFHSGNDY